MSQMISMHSYVSGKVQGVWFRGSTKEKADQLGLTGWVRNLPDKRVEVLVSGERDKVSELQAWLKKGPKLALVTELIEAEVPLQVFTRFDVL